MKTTLRDYEAVFGNNSSVENRVFENYEELGTLVGMCKGRGKTIVLTSGTFDLMHIGHSRYLEKAKEQGDFLIVGVDSDRKTKKRKGAHRPVVPESERLENVCHQRYTGAVFLKNEEEERWKLIRIICPDILVVVEGTYNESEINKLEKICGKVVVLPRQAPISTSEKIRKVMIEPLSELKKRLQRAVQDVYDLLDKLMGNGLSG